MDNIKTIIDTAEVIKELGITGILAVLVVLLALIVNYLHQKREDDRKTIIKLAQGEKIK